MTLKRPLSVANLLIATCCAALFVGCGGSTAFTDGGTQSGGANAKAGTGNTNAGNAGSGNAGTGNTGTGNAGTGNGGTGNAGSGNQGNAGGTSLAGTGGVPPIDGSCATPADCVAVVNTSAACGCGAPIAVSTTDAANNICLVPWQAGTYPEAPAGCAPTGGMVCKMACIAPPACVSVSCDSGKCGAKLGYSTDPMCQGGQTGGGGSGGTDCTTLTNNYSKALAAAQQCDIAINRITCDGQLPSTCSCPTAYDKSGPYGKAAEDAYAALQAAKCQLQQCPCAKPLSTTGTCQASGTTTLGTCGWAIPVLPL